MSRYDGLIIPRSYNEYINKTDAVTLQQALQLSGVLSAIVAAGDNKAVKSSAVYEALTNYINKTDAATLQQALQLPGVLSEAVDAGDNKAVKSSAVNTALANEKKSNYNATITDCNNAYAEGSMSRYVLNGTITSNLPDTTSIYIVESISSNSTISGNNYGYQIATKIGDISNNGDRYIRYRNSANKTWGNWEKITTDKERYHFHKNTIDYGLKIKIMEKISTKGRYFNALFSWSSYGQGNYISLYLLRLSTTDITTKIRLHGITPTDTAKFTIENDDLYFYPNGDTELSGSASAYNLLLS